MSKFKVGDLVVYYKNNSATNTDRKIGDTFVVGSIYSDDSISIYYPETGDISDGEYEEDLRLSSKLQRALK